VFGNVLKDIDIKSVIRYNNSLWFHVLKVEQSYAKQGLFG